MKYIKSFENMNDEPQIGDYVLIYTVALDVNVRDFINNNYGILVDINYGKADRFGFMRETKYVVKYENVPTEIESYFRKPATITPNYKNVFLRDYYKSQIVAFGKTPEEIEVNISANKYNL